MEEWAVGFAKILKGNKGGSNSFEITTGRVINNDLSADNIIQIGDKILLDASDLIIANRVYGLELQVDDAVILIPTANGQTYYLIDKVGV